MDRKYKRIVNIIGWIVFLLSTFLYIFTMYPTTAFWDSGEFIMSSCHLSVGHQPGAPLYQLVGSLFASLSCGNVKLIAPLINALSALCSGLSIMLLYHLFLYLFNKYSSKPIGNTVAAVIASLTFAFTDSFWTQATEAEVYSFSFLFTTICLHIIILWEENPKEKYLILLSLVLGMSYGVHPLTLLVIPAIVFIIYFHYRKITFRGIVYSIIISIVTLYLFMNAFDWMVQLFNISVIIPILGILFLCGVLLYLSFVKRLAFLNSLVFCLLFFFVGCSTYIVIAVRSNQFLPMNEYGVYTSDSMHDYLTRQSYIHPPLFYGPYYTALPAEDFKVDEKLSYPIFNREFYTFFPRMWNYTSPTYDDGYVSWVGQPKNTLLINGEQRLKPSFMQNIQFFFHYQFGYMYWRYLMWNFSGRTNDMQGYGDMTNGNWQTGIYYVDKLFEIDEGKTYFSVKNNANNRYFAVPLILCLIGMFYHIIKDSKRFLFVTTIFVMFSIAIVFYTNVVAYEPRERDYVFLPSFMAVSIWIGIGVLGISQMVANLIRVRHPRYILPLFLILPIWVFSQNIDDHNHRYNYTARNFAISILNSCDKNAILFVDGDNDTYPLWYAQHVEKIRTDVRVINRQMLNNDYYINLLTKPIYELEPLKMTFSIGDYRAGVMDEVQILPNFDTISLKKALKLIKEDNIPDPKFGNHIKNLNYNKFIVNIDGKNIVFTVNDAVLSKRDIIMMDIIASNNDRPIYFSAYSNTDYLSLDDYLSLEGFAYKLTNVVTDRNSFDNINEQKMYANIINGFEFCNFDRNIYFNEIERNIINMYVENAGSLAYKLLQTEHYDQAEILINKITNDIPASVHNYPLTLADFAVIQYVIGNKQTAREMMTKSMKNFKTFIDRYNVGTIKFQSQNRLEAAKRIAFYLNLCVMCENWGLEELRVDVSETFFSVIRPYWEITHRQRKIMLLEEDWYAEEIKKIDDLTSQIKDLADIYEEKLPKYE
ncbi:MAG: glycosyltransferase family 117 protein [Bacteroidales bacterium]